MTNDHHVFDDAFAREFHSRYDKYLAQRGQPALTNLNHVLKTLLDSKFEPSRRLRLRVEQGRIKSANRLLLKAQRGDLRPLISQPADIFTVIRDIVGTRITCNTVNDVHAVVGTIKEAATRSVEPAKSVIVRPSDEEDWEHDYLTKPRPSGYRAIHLLIGVPVAVGDQMEHVTCEVQVRTLLQHAWGELTHEDTYKPGVSVPDIVQALSNRLATVLAVMDEIAQDIRTELEKLETAEAPAIEGGVAPPAEAAASQPRAEAVAPPVPTTSQIAHPSGVESELAAHPQVELAEADIHAAFASVFDHQAHLDAHATAQLVEELREREVASHDELARALEQTLETLEDTAAKYPGVKITDFGLIRYGVRISRDREQGIGELEVELEKTAARIAEERRFGETYAVGRESLGTVVYAGWSYALVQLPEGAKGILHVMQMKRRPDEYVEVSDRVRAGDTVRVQIILLDAKAKRIELRLLDAERKLPAPAAMD